MKKMLYARSGRLGLPSGFFHVFFPDLGETVATELVAKLEAASGMGDDAVEDDLEEAAVVGVVGGSSTKASYSSARRPTAARAAALARLSTALELGVRLLPLRRCICMAVLSPEERRRTAGLLLLLVGMTLARPSGEEDLEEEREDSVDTVVAPLVLVSDDSAVVEEGALLNSRARDRTLPSLALASSGACCMVEGGAVESAIVSSYLCRLCSVFFLLG